MSYSCEVEFLVMRPGGTYTDLVRTLLRSGWAAGNGNELGSIGVEWFNASDRLESQSFPKHALPAALHLLESIERASQRYFFDLHWPGEDAVVSARNDPQGKAVRFSVGRSSTHAIPGLEPLVDHTWYTARLLGPIREAGWSIDVVNWMEAP